MAVLNNEKVDSAVVMGFSAGAITGYYLAANFPARVTKLVTLAGLIDSSGYKPKALQQLKKITGEDCQKTLPDLVAYRKSLMPEPESYDELIDKLRESWLQPIYISEDEAKKIECPVLIIGGDRDEYVKLSEFTRIYKLIPNAQLSIIPNCGHVGLILNPSMIKAMVIPFLSAGSK